MSTQIQSRRNLEESLHVQGETWDQPLECFGHNMQKQGYIRPHWLKSIYLKLMKSLLLTIICSRKDIAFNWASTTFSLAKNSSMFFPYNFYIAIETVNSFQKCLNSKCDDPYPPLHPPSHSRPTPFLHPLGHSHFKPKQAQPHSAGFPLGRCARDPRGFFKESPVSLQLVQLIQMALLESLPSPLVKLTH